MTFSLIVFVAFIIDALLFLYILLKSFTEKDASRKFSEALFKRTEENMDSSKSKPEKIGIVIGVFIFGLILIWIAVMPFVFFVIKWIHDGFVIGLRYFLLYSLFWPLFRVTIRTINGKKTIANEKQRLTIFMFISGVFISYIYTIFGFRFNLYEIILYYSGLDNAISYTLSVLIPSLLIISTVLTFYSVVSKMALLKIEDEKYPHWTIKYPLVFTIVIIAIYSVILYITEFNAGQKIEIDYINMVDTLSVIQNILGAALIPLIIGIFLNVQSEHKVKNRKEIDN